MTLDYFYGQSGELFSYFRIPKALFHDCRFRQLSTDARTLYGILMSVFRSTRRLETNNSTNNTTQRAMMA